jgi:DNA-binding NarL/FixJ family response regulator
MVNEPSLSSALRFSAASGDVWAVVAARLKLPLLVIDLLARLIAANATGQALLLSNPALKNVITGIAPRRVEDSQALSEALERIVARPDESRTCHFSTRDGAPRLALHLQTLTTTPQSILVILTMLVVGIPEPEAQLIAGCLGISRAEARVVGLLTTGLELPEIAERLGLQLTTVRNHIKHAMAKTGVSSKTLLALMVARALLNA